jgi:hypothetical protein
VSRTLGEVLRAAMFAQETGQGAGLLLTITHPQADAPIRLSSDFQTRISTTPLVYGTVSRGETFYYVPMNTALPDEKDQAPARSRLVLSNVGREAIVLARSVSTPPLAKIELIRLGEPDIVEIEFPELDMVGVEYDVNQLTFDLAADALAMEPYPSGSFDPPHFTGLFAG